MKFNFAIPFILLILPSPIWGETISMDNLVERGGIFYKKFTNTPFTGETLWVDPRGYGQSSGKWKNGKKYGEWNNYDSNGQLTTLLNYINGQLNGIAIHYGFGDKVLRTEMWKNDKLDGVSEYFNLDGSFRDRETFKAGELVK